MNKDWYYGIKADAVILRRSHPELREGQAIYIIASNKFPVEVDSISIDDDCFYVDTKIESFLGILGTKMNETTKEEE